MESIHRLLRCWAAAAILLSPAARAGTIDTWNFTEPNYYPAQNNGGNTTPYEAVGSFTGQVEADGLIELADLSAFTVQLEQNGAPVPPFTMGLSQLTLFSFNTNGGASSLDYAGTPNPNISNFCVGAATSLDANCTLNFSMTYPVGTVGVLLFGGPADISSSFPQLTLASSVTTPPPATVPEPRLTWLGGLLLAAGAAARRLRRLRESVASHRSIIMFMIGQTSRSGW
ncbi:MAG TPA: hypothetical protein VFA04_18570 [Bryobacteraceae bacterium]|nr:hypothetical protein [Bryobacteraceae bacterium]